MKLDPIDRLSAKSFVMKTHKKKLKKVDRNEEDETDTSPSKLDSLPLDLKMDILIRLPAKSLMNLKSVSKMWSSIIRNPEFTNSFFAMSSTTQSRFIVALSNGIFNQPEEKLIFFFSFSHEGDESSCLVGNFEMAIASNSFSSQSGTCTSVHGFLSVSTSRQHMICNPTTEQFIKLPIHTRLVGYDPIDDQYKALSVQNKNYCNYLGQILTLGRYKRWRHIQGTTAPYSLVSEGVPINGFVYYGAYSPKRHMNPVIVCFDVRFEKLSFIKAPNDVVMWGYESIFLDYNGKLASIVRFPYARFDSFDLWILEDPKKHEWTKQTCVFPLSLWDYVGHTKLSFPGVNKAGEIIIAPYMLTHDVRPFYMFYYNVITKNIRRVRLLGIGDDEDFRRCYGFVNAGACHVRIAPQHIPNIAFLKEPMNLTSFQGSKYKRA